MGCAGGYLPSPMQYNGGWWNCCWSLDWKAEQKEESALSKVLELGTHWIGWKRWCANDDLTMEELVNKSTSATPAEIFSTIFLLIVRFAGWWKRHAYNRYSRLARRQMPFIIWLSDQSHQWKFCPTISLRMFQFVLLVEPERTSHTFNVGVASETIWLIECYLKLKFAVSRISKATGQFIVQDVAGSDSRSIIRGSDSASVSWLVGVSVTGASDLNIEGLIVGETDGLWDGDFDGMIVSGKSNMS